MTGCLPAIATGLVDAILPVEDIGQWIAAIVARSPVEIATAEAQPQAPSTYDDPMLFMEAFEKKGHWPGLKVFANDAEQANIDIAWAGNYPESIAAEVPPHLLERYFMRKGESFSLRRELRQSLVFARHNLRADPPFTRMDLVVCRNALIYFRPGAQERALRQMQYALQPGGVFLGSSETLVNERRPGNVGPASYRNGRRDDVAAPQPMSAVDHGDTTLLRAYAPPPAFLINQRHEVVHSYGDVRHILEIRPGAASLDLARLLPDNLATVAAAILFKLGRSGNSLTSNYVPLPAEGEHQGDTLYLLVFEEETARAAASDMVDIGSETAERIEILENELTATRESLQSTIEEMMASNDELQSVDEELNTVNAEYQEKIDILNRVNADLDSLTRIVSSGAVFVDPELRLTRFSPDASSIFRLREAGVGRPLSDLNHTLDYPGLITDLRRTLTDFTEVERQVAGPNGRRFLARFLPYRVPSSAERAAVLTFVDMTQSRNVQLLQSILDGLDAHISVLDCEGRIRMVNAAWNRFAQANGHADLAYSQPGTRYLDSCAVNPDIADHGDAERAVGGVRDERLDQRVMRDGVSLTVSEVRTAADGQGQITHLNTRKFPLHDDFGQIIGVASRSRDIKVETTDTERLRLNAAVVEHSLDAIVVMDPDMRSQKVNPALQNIMGFGLNCILGKTLDSLLPPTRVAGRGVRMAIGRAS